MNSLPSLLGRAPGIVRLREQIHQVVERTSHASRRPPILLEGETGTGKNLVAGLIHRAGPRRDGPFVDVNCAAIPETLLEAELFGFERGAFTDARQPKAGLFQCAHGGTIFLDEIALLPESLQAKLLKVVEERTVRRLGSTRGEPVDVAIIAATNEDLAAAVDARRFRQDLYHRLAVVRLRLPPLRARPDDVPVLAEHFLERACKDYGLPPKSLTPAAHAVLRAHTWPGNVRELANTMERVALLTETSHISAEALALPIAPASAEAGPVAPPAAGLHARIETLERQELLRALQETRWNVVRAAASLGITRGTIRYRLEKYALAPPARRTRPRAAPVAPVPPPTPAAPSPLTTPRWETRLVALLEATTETELGRDFDVVVQKVESFGGRVEEAGTSRVVAAFGLDPAEDAPRRAALAAMAIRNAQATYPSPARRAPITIAVHAEPCPVAYVSGRAEVDGEARHRIMARLDELCARGEPEVLVSHAASSLLAPRFDFEEPDVRTDPSGRASRLLGYARHRFGLGAHPGPFVGREHELGVLQARWQEARSGRGQIVALVGEPGIGKSRLLFEFRQTLGDEPPTYLEGRGESYGGGIPYLPVIDFLRGFFHIEEWGDPAATAEKVRAGLFTLDPALTPDVSPFLALLDAPVTDPQWPALEPAQRRQRTLDALRRFVLRLSQIQPVLLAIEDLHWIDAETQAFLDRLIVSLPAARLLVIVSYRPEYRTTVGSQVSYTQLHLDPLAEASAAALVRALVGDHVALQPLARMLIERTEGNPFFLEESVRTLVETRALVGERGAYRPTSELHALEVPPTVRAVLAARVDRLAPEDKHVLQAAAVIGRDVPFGLVLAIAEVSEATLRRALTDLQAAEFLREARLFPDVEYTFKHALTQEVAYDGLPPERRQALHAGVVEAMERAYADRLADQVERLAHHARAAELWDKALAYCRQAGAKAAWRSAHREAVQYFEQALAAIRRVPETPATRAQTLDLHLQLRWSLVPLGDYHRLAESLRHAAALAEGLNDPLRFGEISQSMTNYLRLAGDCDGALEAGRRAHAIGADLGSHTLEVRATYQLGLVYRQRGEYPRAIEALASVVEALRGELLYERFGEPSVLSVHARAWLAMTLADVGRFSDGLALAEEAVQIASDSRNAFSQTTAHLSLGSVHARQGDLDRALPPLERSVALCRDGNFRLLLPPTASAFGAALSRAERVEEALPLLELAVEAAAAQGLIGGSSLYQVRLGHALLLAKRGVEARELAHRALDAARKHKERGHEAWALHLLGDVAALGEPADSVAAARSYAEALALAQALGMQPLVAQCQRRLGTGGR